MDIHERFHQLERLMGMVEESTRDGKMYTKMVQTGGCANEFHDYGTGFLAVIVSVSKRNNAYHVLVSLATIDDGDYGGASKGYHDQEKAHKVAASAAKIFSSITTLPAVSQLNKMLTPVGIAVGRM